MIHYLYHLEDSCRESSSGLERASSLAQEISESVASRPSLLDKLPWQGALEDLAFFKKELEQAQKDLLDTRKMV